MMKLFYSLLLSVILLSSCTQSYQQLPSGLEYRMIERVKEGVNAKPGDILTLNMVYKTESDSILFRSSKVSDSFRFILKKPKYKGAIDEGLAMMKPGDSACFKVDAEKFYNETLNQHLPSNVNKGSKILFQVRLLKITPLKEYEKELAVAKRKKSEEELEQIKTYISDHQLKGEFLSTGTYFIEMQSGKGKSANYGDRVDVLYEGYFLDGRVFDKKTDPLKPLQCTVGSNGLVDGWNEALQRMKESGKVKVILPSSSAYGERGYGPIPPFTPIVFEIELLKVYK